MIGGASRPEIRARPPPEVSDSCRATFEDDTPATLAAFCPTRRFGNKSLLYNVAATLRRSTGRLNLSRTASRFSQLSRARLLRPAAIGHATESDPSKVPQYAWSVAGLRTKEEI